MAANKPTPAKKQAAAKKPVKQKPAAPAKQPDKPIPKYHIDHKTWDKAAVMDQICAELSVSSFSIHNICKRDPELPSVVTIYAWFNEEERGGGDTPLLNQYARGKEAQADFMADEMLDIADNGANDWMDKAQQDGSVTQVVDHEHIQRSKLRIDSRKWIAAKLKPKKYGDKLELTGDPERPLSAHSDKELEAQILALMKKMRTDEPK